MKNKEMKKGKPSRKENSNNARYFSKKHREDEREVN